MATWMKVLLAAGALLVALIVGAVVAGFFVVRKYGPALMEASQQTYAEGVEYGRRADNEGCLNEAAARHAHVNGFTDFVRNGVFMESCLKASRPTPGFCDGVPRQTEFIKGAAWQQQQCKRFGLRQEQQCGQLFQGVQRFCEERERAGGGADGVEAPPPPRQPAAPSH